MKTVPDGAGDESAANRASPISKAPVEILLLHHGRKKMRQITMLFVENS